MQLNQGFFIHPSTEGCYVSTTFFLFAVNNAVSKFLEMSLVYMCEGFSKTDSRKTNCRVIGIIYSELH